MRRALAAPGRAAQSFTASRTQPARSATPMAAAAGPLTGNPEVTSFIEGVNAAYERAHVAYEVRGPARE